MVNPFLVARFLRWVGLSAKEAWGARQGPPEGSVEWKIANLQHIYDSLNDAQSTETDPGSRGTHLEGMGRFAEMLRAYGVSVPPPKPNVHHNAAMRKMGLK